MKADDRRDRELIRQLRRELDEAKRRNTDMITELSDLRKERDQSKMQLNEEIIRHAREVEDERNQKRLLQSEADKLSFKAKCAEDEAQKLRLKAEKKAQEVTGLLSERNSMTGIMKEKDLLIDSHLRQMQQLKEDLKLKNQEIDLVQRRNEEHEKDRSLQELKDRSKLQKELEVLEKNYVELEQTRKHESQTHQKAFD